MTTPIKTKAAKATKAPVDPAKAAAKAAKATASTGGTGEFQPPSGDKELSAAGKQAIQRAEQARAEEAEDLARAESGQTLEMTQVQLLITRDNTKQTVDAFEYEQPIYEAIHGEENVDRIGERVVDVLDWNPDTAFDTLIRKFGKQNDGVVRGVYPSERALANEVGYKYSQTSASRKRDKSGQGSLVIDHSKPESVQELSRERVARVVSK